MGTSLGSKDKVRNTKEQSDYIPSAYKSFESAGVGSFHKKTLDHTEAPQPSNFGWAYVGTGEVESVEADFSRPVPSGYSLQYIQIKTRELITLLQKELSAWQENGTDESLANISAMKDAIDSKFNYLSQDSDFRLFVSTLRLVINKWKTLDTDQVQALNKQLESYSDGQISSNDILSFNEFLFENGISLVN